MKIQVLFQGGPRHDEFHTVTTKTKTAPDVLYIADGDAEQHQKDVWVDIYGLVDEGPHDGLDAVWSASYRFVAGIHKAATLVDLWVEVADE